MTRRIPLYPLVSAAVLACSSCSSTNAAQANEQAPPADVVVSWNEQIFQIAEVEDAFLTLKGARTAAMAHQRRQSRHGGGSGLDEPARSHLRVPVLPPAHGTVCAAAATVFEDVFGANRPFVMTIPEIDSQGPMSPKIPTDPPSRSFSSFDEAAVECSMSRVYLGIHFRYDSEVGTELGRQVGEHAVASVLQPVESRRP